ncbi:MAG: hypothetical protein BWK79_16840 [Beggiatoa sp. IS2]|nr:MAG: hypothetical protein BWK79_16840 [Beggiatoa sp. IS2]
MKIWTPASFLGSHISSFSGKFSLRTVLIVTFVTQIMAAIALTGWLSFRGGQRAVDDLAYQLRDEVTARIGQHLKIYTATPHLINRINADNIRLGLLKLNSIHGLDQYFYKQIQQFNTVSYIGLATEQPQYIGVKIRDDASTIIEILDETTQGHLETWETNDLAQRTERSSITADYDPRQRPWYRAAIKTGKPVWTEIYVYTRGNSTGISANHPLYDSSGHLLGVATTDLTLLDIGQFLKNLKISEHGQTFIMERSGLLIATSTTEKPYRINPLTHRAEPLNALMSRDSLTRAVAHYLTQQFTHFNNIDQSQQLDFTIEGQKHFLQVVPFTDEWGLDWLIVAVVPERDIMARIIANTHITIILCFIAFLVATAISISIARWIVQPLTRLNLATKAITQGEWQLLPETSRQDEVGELAKSFSYMTKQLHELFNTLEQKVEDRTRDIEAQNIQLAELNDKLLQLNQDKNEFLGIVAHDLKNPLAGIQGAAELLLTNFEGMTKEEVTDFLRMMQTASHQMFELIKNLLDVNVIESGKMNISLQFCDILPILQRLVSHYAPIAMSKNISLHFLFQQEQYIAFVDKNTVYQIFDNLISNAVKYSLHNKAIHISIDQSDSKVYCEIRDEGPGLSDEDQQKLFGKFAQLTPRPTGSEHSTGLGLFIVKKLVEVIGGNIKCRSELGHGTTFIVELKGFGN